MEKIPPGVSLSLITLGVNPDGSGPNFVDPPTLAPVVRGIGVIIAIVSTLFVAARLASKIHTTRVFSLDDCMSPAFLIFCGLWQYTHLLVVFSGAALLLAHAYTVAENSRHEWDFPLSFIDESYVKRTIVSGIIYGPGLWCAKMAILVLQLRVFAPKNWFRVMVYVGIALVTFVHWSNVPIYGILCIPHRGEKWDMVLLSSKRCSAASTHTVITGAIGTTLDIYILILPLPIIAELNLAPRRKLGLVLVFMAGIFAIIASACALYFRVVMWKGHDISWNAAKGVLCVFVETYVGIIVGCTPSVVALWKTGILKSIPLSTIRWLLSFSRFSTVRDHGKTERADLSGGDSHERLPGYRPVDGYNHIQGN